jgi:methionine sulfoxide reductase heme-binding subunit
VVGQSPKKSSSEFLNSAAGHKLAPMVVFVASCLPLAALAMITAIPQGVIRSTGDWSPIFLALTLAITPLRKLLGIPNLIRFRKMLGLFAFLYACIHLLAFRLHHVTEASPRWNFRLAVAALVLMATLAVTSTSAWIHRLGGRRWHMLHTLVYPSAIFGAAHSYLLALGPFGTRPLFRARGSGSFPSRRTGRRVGPSSVALDAFFRFANCHTSLHNTGNRRPK